MNVTGATPGRVEHQQTDKGYVPVYTTAVIEQPWDAYTAVDHNVWAQLFERQRKLLVGRASDEEVRVIGALSRPSSSSSSSRTNSCWSRRHRARR